MITLSKKNIVKMQKLLICYNENSKGCFKKRKAVSDIIVTLLLVSITVIGGILAWTLVSGEGSLMADVGSTITEPPETFTGGIKIIAYDTRDGQDLSGIDGVDNDATSDGVLSGGEFIVLKVVNDSPGPVVLNDFQINDESHTYDTGFSLTPAAGKFSVIDGENPGSGDPNVLTSAEINEGVTVRVVVGLSNDLSDIKLNKAIRIHLDASGFDTQKFIIKAGNTR